MNKPMIIAIYSVLFCTTGVAVRQVGRSYDTPKGASLPLTGWYSLPMSARQRSIIARIGSLDRAAAAALDEQRYSEAEGDAREALSLGLDSGLGQELLATALNAQGKTQEALQAYKVMAEEGDTYPRNELPYALLLLETGHWPQAVAAYNKQLPYLADGDLMVANSHFSPAEPQPRGLATAIHVALGLTYGAAATWGGHSQDARAMTEFQRALALAPDSALAHFYYADALQHLGRRQEARAAFQKAAELGEGDVRAAAEQALK